ncbi:MAG: hypothetical protein FD123_3043 [Bacteroidetes bacterium]|nr:MAG: hypothetical protein FD123_3043 [Bacteroidota bacterium]
MLRQFLFLFLFSTVLAPARAQQDSVAPVKAFRFTYENDFFTATDYYFTQGVRIEIVLPAFRKNPVSRLLLSLHGGLDEEFGLSVNQQCFTPTSIREDVILFGDRPFAGAIFIGFHRISVHPSKMLRITSELDLGGVGPCSSCRETQESIHTWLDNVYPHGWQFQVQNGPVLNYTAKLEKGFFARDHVDLSGHGTAAAGTLYSNLAAGMLFRAGWMRNYFTVPDAKTKLRFWFTGGGEIRAVGWNATLQGPVFSKNNPYTIANDDLRRLVLQGRGGLELSFRKLHVQYFHYYLTPEFRTGLKHSWGHCRISLLF